MCLCALLGCPLFTLLEVLVIKCSFSNSCVKGGMPLRFFVHSIVFTLWSSCLALPIFYQKYIRAKTASMFWFVKRTFDQTCVVLDRSSIQATSLLNLLETTRSLCFFMQTMSHNVAIILEVISPGTYLYAVKNSKIFARLLGNFVIPRFENPVRHVEYFRIFSL